MIIFLGIIGELATIAGTIGITVNSIFDAILEIPKNGYRIDKEALEEFQNASLESKTKRNKATLALGTVLLLVPGVNLINAGIKGAILKRSVMKDPKIKSAIVPMTELEKEEYSKLDGKFERLAYTAYVTKTERDKDQEFLGFFGKSPIVVDHGLTALFYEELTPLNYTLDEVERLNNATSCSYRIGKIDDKFVAVIGIPNPNSPVSRIQFKEEGYRTTHDFETITEEEAQYATFTVYPFAMNDILKSRLDRAIEEIKKSRIDSEAIETLEELQEQTVVEQDYIPTEPETSLMREQQGPVLRKNITPPKYE